MILRSFDDRMDLGLAEATCEGELCIGGKLLIPEEDHLDIQARATAEEAGIRFLRAPTVGTHPAFIKMLAHLIRKKKPAGQKQEVSKA